MDRTCNASRAAAARRRSLCGHRHGVCDGSRFRRRGAVQAPAWWIRWIRTHYRSCGSAAQEGQLSREWARIFTAHQIQAFEPKHLHQPEAHRTVGQRVPKAAVLATVLHRFRRTGARPQLLVPSCMARYNFEDASWSAKSWSRKTTTLRSTLRSRDRSPRTKLGRKKSRATFHIAIPSSATG